MSTGCQGSSTAKCNSPKIQKYSPSMSRNCREGSLGDFSCELCQDFSIHALWDGDSGPRAMSTGCQGSSTAKMKFPKNPKIITEHVQKLPRRILGRLPLGPSIMVSRFMHAPEKYNNNKTIMSRFMAIVSFVPLSLNFCRES